MTNDTAMTKQESEVMIEQLKKVFEVVRLLDVDTLEMGNLKGVEDVDGFPCKCYDFWKKGTRCKNCTSREALQKKEKVLKLEYLNSNIYQVISKYIEIDGKPYVIELINAMKAAGKTTFLEVVTYSEEECMAGAKLAVELGFDYLMGTIFYDSVFKYLNENGMKYLPFCGKVHGSPSVPEGTFD